MTYGYIRVSTDKQTVENQRHEINRFCEAQAMVVSKWYEETISGTKDPKGRELGRLLKKMKAGDVLICSELSRLGRSLLMIMGVLNECMNRDIKVWTIKDGYRLGSDISSKVLAFAFGLSAEIERNLISQRTKEALARKKAEGVVLGRPFGSRSARTKLSGQEKKIQELLDRKVSYCAIGRILGVHRLTVSSFAKRMHETGSQKTDATDNGKTTGADSERTDATDDGKTGGNSGAKTKATKTEKTDGTGNGTGSGKTGRNSGPKTEAMDGRTDAVA